FLFAKYFPVIAVAEIKSILKTSGEGYKRKMTDIEKADSEKFYTDEVAHAH
ncbi:MAG: hydrogenase, partial [Bacteroidota bacterium]